MHDSFRTGRCDLPGPDKKKKKFRFSTGTNEIVESSPVIGKDGTIYIVSTDNRLYLCNFYAIYAINPNGTEKWYFHDKRDTSSLSSPMVDSENTIYFGKGSFFYAINPDGTLKWSFQGQGTFESSPCMGSDGRIYVGGGKYLYAFDKNGKKIWEFETDGTTYKSSPAVSLDGTIYIASEEKFLQLILMELKNGFFQLEIIYQHHQA